MISVIVPTLEEEENIYDLVLDIERHCSSYNKEVFILDDGSQDSTFSRAAEAAEKIESAEVISRDGRRGIGAAILEGMNKASGEIAVPIGADFSHPVERIPDLVEEIESGSEVAIGSRYVAGGSRNDPFHRRINPLIGSFLYQNLLGTPVKDVTSGFKAYNRRAREHLLEVEHHLPDGFHFQAASLVSLYENGHDLSEVPIDFRPRRAGKPKYGLSDLLDNVRLLLKLSSRKHLYRSRSGIY